MENYPSTLSDLVIMIHKGQDINELYVAFGEALKWSWSMSTDGVRIIL
jgi:hypothetical protein